MATRKSALKHIRADVKKRNRNFERKSALRNMLKNTEAAIRGGDVQQAEGLYRQAAGQLDRAVRKGVIKKGMADRRKSRLALKINKIAAA
ncbi:MAG: 30S ribosomal protein S20 [Candidatus Poribacteria bacterium]|nr:30S ribosomal protein S20 [Candidatus Poribacteria bacterium]